MAYYKHAAIFLMILSIYPALAASDKGWEVCGDGQSQFPLHQAVLDEDIETISCMLEGNYDPNTLNKYGNTALIHAIGRSLPIVEILISYGVDVNKPKGQPLVHALSNLGTFIRDQNLGNEVEGSMNIASETLYKILDANADYSRISFPENDPMKESQIFRFVYEVCEISGSAFKKHKNYEKYFDQIISHSKHKISFDFQDSEGLKNLKILSKLDLFDIHCIETAFIRFSPV